LECQVDGELPHHGLPRSGGGRHEDALPLLHHVAGVDLEAAETELVQLSEGVEDRMGGHARTVSAPLALSTVRGSGPKRSPSAYDTMPGAATVTERTRWCSYCGWWTWVPLNSFGYVRIRSGFEIGLMMTTSSKPSSSTAPSVMRRPPPNDDPFPTATSIASRDTWRSSS